MTQAETRMLCESVARIDERVTSIFHQLADIKKAMAAIEEKSCHVRQDHLEKINRIEREVTGVKKIMYVISSAISLAVSGAAVFFRRG